MSPSISPGARRTRVATALTGAFTIGIATALALPAAAFGAQGDNEVVIDVIEQVTPAIVTIQGIPQARSRVRGGEPPGDFQLPDDFELPDDLELPEGFELPDDIGSLEELRDLLPEDFDFGQFRIPQGFQFRTGSGSGVIIAEDGLIITNRHVVGDAETVRVILDDGSVLEGTVTGVDSLTDFAFVDVETDALPAVTLGDSSEIKVGQLAITLGNPLGRFPSSASVGIISGLDRSLDVFGAGRGGSRLNHLIQTDAAVNPGNSGGAVFNGDGELIGITTAEAGMSDGIGFALPIDLAKPIIAQAQAGEAITRPYIGVIFRELDAQVAADESLPVTAGAWIRADGLNGTDPVVAGSPAAEAGIHAGDIITAVAGLAVDRDNPLDLQVLRFAPGEEVIFSVLRDGETLDLPTVLGTRPADLNG